jgi:hypothetical protein
MEGVLEYFQKKTAKKKMEIGVIKAQQSFIGVNPMPNSSTEMQHTPVLF